MTTVTGEYRVARYSAAHRQAVLDLHGQLLPRTRRVTERYFAWKYEENPYLGEPLLALVFAGQSLVAMRGLCGTQWVTPDGATEVIPAAEDLIIDPEHRNRGLFLLLDRELARMAADRGYGTMLSLSANATTRRLQDITGWARVAGFGRAVRESRLPPGAVSAQPVIRRLRAKGTSLARRAGLATPARLADINVARILRGIDGASPSIRVGAEAEPATLAALAQPAEALRQAHTEEFYRWRLQNPDRQYRFVYWADPTTRGFVILGFQPADPRRVLIVDAAATEPGILLELLKAVTRADRPSLTVLPEVLPAEVRTRLPDHGFADGGEPADEPMVVVFERTTSRHVARHTSARWHTPLLDTMLG